MNMQFGSANHYTEQHEQFSLHFAPLEHDFTNYV